MTGNMADDMTGGAQTLPNTMTAVAIEQPGGPDVLVAVTRSVPVPAAGEVLIKVAAAGVNRPDCLQRAGAYPPPPGASDLPGLEVAGVVAAIGDGVARFAVGDNVCALTPGGGYAEYAVAPQGQVLPVPAGLDMVEAACLPETFFTVWSNVFMRGGLKAGETLLIHGGASGIGTTAIQLGKAFGARVVVTAGSDERCAACVALGADRGVNHRTEDFVEAVKTETGGRGADVILDMVGGAYIQRNYRAAAVDGRIVQIAFLGGAKAEVDFTLLMAKRLTHTGSTLRPQSLEAKARIAAELEQKVWPLIANGTVRPRIEARFALERACDAHRRMETQAPVGKLVLTVD